VGDVLERVRRLLERSATLAEPQRLQRVVVAAEQLGQQLAIDPVGLVLSRFTSIQYGSRSRKVFSRAMASAVSSADRRSKVIWSPISNGRWPKPGEHDEVGGGLDRVHHIVQGAGEAVDVLAVERP